MIKKCTSVSEEGGSRGSVGIKAVASALAATTSYHFPKPKLVWLRIFVLSTSKTPTPKRSEENFQYD
jgi:hypothetical protein